MLQNLCKYLSIRKRRLKWKINFVKIFCIYTLLVPLIAYLLTGLNDEFGVTCADGCKVHSYTIYHFIQFSFLGICVLNIFLCIIAKKWLKNLGTCVGAIIFNCIFCLYMALLSINAWNFMLIMFPAIVTVPIQFTLLRYVLFKELLRKQGKVFLSSFLFGICCFIWIPLIIAILCSIIK